MSAHTPGPWLVVHELRDSDEAVCDLVNNTWVIKGHFARLGNWNADAALIAAAPDLLSALQELLFLAEREIADAAHVTEVTRARAAIKKATQ